MADSSTQLSRVVGILGGMGPRATVDFYDKLVEHTPATRDQDHLRVVIWADPTVPSRQEALLANGTDPTPWLQDGLDRLTDAGAEIVVVPCNTVHAYVGPLMKDRPVEFLSIIDVTVAAIQRQQAQRVGILATDGALAAGIFQQALDRAGIDWILPSPDDQRRLTQMVESVKGGRVDASHHRQLADVLLSIRQKGATLSIAGCTEISALANSLPTEVGAELIDPSLELALATIRRASLTSRADGPTRLAEEADDSDVSHTTGFERRGRPLAPPR